LDLENRSVESKHITGLIRLMTPATGELSFEGPHLRVSKDTYILIIIVLHCNKWAIIYYY
jgi:hypothetical protein